MNIQIFGSKKSNDSKKAERWFKEGFDALIDTRCDAYEDLGLQYVPPQAVDARIADCPAVFIAPIVRNGKQATVGYHPEIWETWK